METAERQCGTCGALFKQPGRGAPKRYCQTECRPSARSIAVRLTPEELAVAAKLYRRATGIGA